jgi:hypothetical protein
MLFDEGANVRIPGCLFAIVFILSGAANAPGQDPFKVAPAAYKLEFQNEWVRVTRVHYGPKEKIAPHYHTDFPAAYVYLNDSGPVVFKHKDLPYGAITRPPTKAGGFRLYRSVKEVHEVENLSETPSDFLRVEFKTEPVNEKSLYGKFYRETYPAGENSLKVQFENEQIRVTRIVIAQQKVIDLPQVGGPSLLVSLTESSLEREDANNTKLNLAIGTTAWIGSDQRSKLRNAGAAVAELLLFDFKTKPLTSKLDRSTGPAKNDALD